jgi:hypothetical protein
MNRAKLGHESKPIPNGSHGKVGYVVLQTSIPPGMKTELVQVAKNRDTSIADLVRNAIGDHLQTLRRQA